MDSFWQFLVPTVGAIASVVAAYFAWKSYRSNRSKLYGLVEFNSLGDRGSELVIKITNRGQRPTFVEEIKIVHSTGSIPYSAYIDGMKELPLKLDEGKPEVFLVPVLDVYYRENIQEIARAKFVIVRDSKGEEYRFPSLSIFELLRWRNTKRQLKKAAQSIAD